MKIGINSRIYQNPNTGIHNYIAGLYNKLLNTDTINEYSFFQTNINKTIGDTRILKLPDSLYNNLLFDNFLINKLIVEAKIDVFHGPAGVIPFIKKNNVKYIVTIHDLSFLLFPKYNTTVFNLYFSKVLKRSIMHSDIVIADSKSTKKDILNYFSISKNKIKVIYPGLNELYLKHSRIKRLIKQKYFLTMSTHTKRKNIERVIQVIGTNKKFSNILLVIVGLIPTNQLQELTKLINANGLSKKVIIYGYVTDKQLASLYQNAECLIYPSYYEGFGFPVLEAMASKCPVVSSNVSSIPEIMPDKDWLIDPYDSMALTAKVIEVLSLSATERKKMIEKNYNFAKNFTWDKCARKMMQIFKS